MPLTGTWDWPSKIAGNWDCLPKISWDFGICQNSRIIGWDFKNSSNWELGFGLRINWELGLRTPHHDPYISTNTEPYPRTITTNTLLVRNDGIGLKKKSIINHALVDFVKAIPRPF